jgi:transposase
MNQGKYVFSQLMDLVHSMEFSRCVKRYDGDKGVRSFSCWHQFLCLSFGQLTHRNSLRDITTCLEAHSAKHYHLGLTNGVSRSTLAEANEKRNWQIYADLAQLLIKRAQAMDKSPELEGLAIDNKIYALDSSTVDLCLEVFWWAKFRKTKGAIKLHTLLDIKHQIPVFVHITDGAVSDVKVLDIMEFEPGAFYVMDRGYVDWGRLYKIESCKAFFVTRAKTNTVWSRVRSAKVEKEASLAGIRCDQTIKLSSAKGVKEYPVLMRRVKYYDAELKKTFVFLTNNFELSALQIALLYKNRWKVELFFKWIKQHLDVKVFWGYSENAVKTQIWVAVCVYVLVKIMKEKLKISQTMNEILQILSVSIFDKTPVNQLFRIPELQELELSDSNQLNLFEL